MRTMGDIDIFYNEKKTLKVRQVMKNMGFKIVKVEDKHDKYYKKPFMTLELHKVSWEGLSPMLLITKMFGTK